MPSCNFDHGRECAILEDKFCPGCPFMITPEELERRRDAAMDRAKAKGYYRRKKSYEPRVTEGR